MRSAQIEPDEVLLAPGAVVAANGAGLERQEIGPADAQFALVVAQTGAGEEVERTGRLNHPEHAAEPGSAQLRFIAAGTADGEWGGRISILVVVEPADLPSEVARQAPAEADLEIELAVATRQRRIF